MALDKAVLKTKLIHIFSQANTESNIEQIAQEIADAVDAYIKTAKIVYSAGLIAPNGAVTGTFNGNLE